MSQEHARSLSWSLCIATLNRQTVLLRTLKYAALQTCPPAEIVVVDVSDNWEETRTLATEVLASFPDIELNYVHGTVRSSTVQRNVGLKQCNNDIVFMIDDDSFMFETCAEEILKIYRADDAHNVACISAKLVHTPPPNSESTAGLVRKASGSRNETSRKKRFRKSKLGRWINDKILFQSKDEIFLKYDEPRDLIVPDAVKKFDVVPTPFMSGSAMTVRRDVAMREPFDPSLRYYAAGEDLDVSYRYGRHGAVLRSRRAHLHHFEVAGGRIKRKEIIIFQLLNMLIFLKRHSPQPQIWTRPYKSMLRRRLFGEFLKDALSGRFSFPQAAGVIVAMRHWRKVWSKDVEELDDWYPGFQKTILERL